MEHMKAKRVTCTRHRPNNPTSQQSKVMNDKFNFAVVDFIVVCRYKTFHCTVE